MQRPEAIKKEDWEFYTSCLDRGYGENYFRRIKYDKTLHERVPIIPTTPANQEAKKALEIIIQAITGKDSVIAARCTGSYPAGLCAAAVTDVKETFGKDLITLEAVEPTKAPDLDIEIVAKSYTFLNTSEFMMMKNGLLNRGGGGIRVSIGIIDYGSIQNHYSKLNHHIRTTVRWGFLRNEIVLKGPDFYESESKKIWESFGPSKKDVVEFVATRHLYYSMKNAIKYGRATKFEITKDECPEIYAAEDLWKHGKKDLFFKEDF
jgi:hypothetical protein